MVDVVLDQLHIRLAVEAALDDLLRQLDCELADGRGCEAPEDRALRARQLANPRARRALAGSLRHVVGRAENPRAGLVDSKAPVVREAVIAWREALLGLAEHVEQPATVDPCGVARLRVLLSDGAGPLFNPAPERSIGTET